MKNIILITLGTLLCLSTCFSYPQTTALGWSSWQSNQLLMAAPNLPEPNYQSTVQVQVKICANQSVSDPDECPESHDSPCMFTCGFGDGLISQYYCLPPHDKSWYWKNKVIMNQDYQFDSGTITISVDLSNKWGGFIATPNSEYVVAGKMIDNGHWEAAFAPRAK